MGGWDKQGICQYLALAMVPLWNGIKALFGIATAAPAPPAYAPPAPPPPPQEPPLVTKITTAMWSFAEVWPVTYLLIDLSLAVLVGAFFLFLKDIEDWMERRRLAGLAADKEAAKGANGAGGAGAAAEIIENAPAGYMRLEDEMDQGDSLAAGALDEDDPPEVIMKPHMRGRIVGCIMGCTSNECASRCVRCASLCQMRLAVSDAPRCVAPVSVGQGACEWAHGMGWIRAGVLTGARACDLVWRSCGSVWCSVSRRWMCQ